MSLPADAMTQTQAASRPDIDIQADVEAALWNESRVRVLDWGNIRVDVRDGEVFLHGHLASGSLFPLVTDIAASVPGVRAVNNWIVPDMDLQREVAQALASDPRTRPHLIRVGAEHGWIHLSGQVPTPEARAAAEEVAAGVPEVRGVLNLPALPGAVPVPNRPRLQPEIGATVSASDGSVGTVRRVVIDPRNRLVSHAVVMGGPMSGEMVVPVEAIEVVNPGDVLVKDSRRDLASRPAFRDEDFPPPPPDWQPPYPYRPEDVRWPKNQ